MKIRWRPTSLKDKVFRDRESSFSLVIFTLALALRLVYLVQSEENPLLYYPVLDEAYYVDLGRSVASGFWLGEERAFFMDPLYGYLLGLLFSIFSENLAAVRLFQILLDAANAVLICVLGTRIWNRTAGIFAGVLYGMYKVAFFYSLLILKTTVTITLLLLFMLAVLGVIHTGRSSRWFFLGLAAALMVHFQANFLLIVPLTIFFYWGLVRPKHPQLLRQSLLFLGGVAALLSLGALRNYWVSGELVWLNTQSGRLLYSCNNPENLTGRYNVPSFSRAHPEDSEQDFHREAEQRLGRRLSATEASRYWTGQTVRFLVDNPGVIPVLLKNRMKGTIGDYEIPDNHSFYLAARFSGIAQWPLPTFAFILALGIPGLAMGFASRREAFWLLLPLLTVCVTISVFYTSSRFRMPAVPLLIVGSGICLERLSKWIQAKDVTRTMVVLSISALLYALSVSLSDPRDTGTEEFFLAKAYWSQSQLHEAKRVASEAAKRFPGQARFPTLLGMVALSENRLDEAVRYNRMAIGIDPGYADAYHNLGIAYLLVGQREEAVKFLKIAHSLSPNIRYLFTLAKAYEALGDKQEAIKNYREYLKVSKPGDPYGRLALEQMAGLN